MASYRVTSHGLPSPDPVDRRDLIDFLFEADGQRDLLLQTLYTESLVNRRDVDAIDRLLDAHRAAYGEPEQVAYAQQRDGLHDRPLPLMSSDGWIGDAGLQLYMEEHRVWNPVTRQERALSSQTLGMSA